MNRQAKRMMQRQKTTSQDRLEAMQKRQRVVAQERRKRTPMREFLKQVRAELKKVAWPSRKELWGYTVVVLVAVVVLTCLVFALDLGFSKAILHIFGGGPG